MQKVTQGTRLIYGAIACRIGTVFHHAQAIAINRRVGQLAVIVLTRDDAVAAVFGEISRPCGEVEVVDIIGVVLIQLHDSLLEVLRKI